MEKYSSADSALLCRRPTLDMSSKAGSKRPATVPSEPSNHTMVSEVPPERPAARVGTRSCAARQAAAETGFRGPPQGLSCSSSPLQTSRSSRKGIAFGKRSNSMKRNPNAAVTKSGWLYKQVPEPCLSQPRCPTGLCHPLPLCSINPSLGGCSSHCPSLAGQLGGEAVEQALVCAGGSLPLLLQRYGKVWPPWMPPRQDPVPTSQLPPCKSGLLPGWGLVLPAWTKGGPAATTHWGPGGAPNTSLCHTRDLRG